MGQPLARWRLVALAALVLASCGSAPADGVTSELATRAECLVDGRPLSSYPPLPLVAAPPSLLVTEDLANGLRFYQLERYHDAAEALGAEVVRGPIAEAPQYWARARYTLASALSHLGRDDEARALFLDIARTERDPYAWSAAGRLCGERRAPSPIELEASASPIDAPTEDALMAAWREASRAASACSHGRAGCIRADLAVDAEGAVAEASLVTASWYDVDYRAGERATPNDAPTGQCVLRGLRALRLPPGIGRVRLVFELR